MKADIGAVAAASTCFDRKVREEDSLPHRYNYCSCFMPVLPFKLSNVLHDFAVFLYVENQIRTLLWKQDVFSSVEVFIHFITYCENDRFTCGFFFFRLDFIYILAVLV